MVKNFKNELTLEVPKNITAKLEGKTVTIKGPKGSVVKNYDHIRDFEINLENNVFHFKSYFARKSTVAKMGTVSSLINNVFLGVTKGYIYKMIIGYSHFPITVEPPKTQNGDDAIKILNFLGERDPRTTYTTGPNIKVDANKEEVIITGIDKEAVSQTCANIQKKCHISHKDYRVFQDGIYVYSKGFQTGEVFWSIK
jgi:large subunit ribosomal protein L6